MYSLQPALVQCIPLQPETLFKDDFRTLKYEFDIGLYTYSYRNLKGHYDHCRNRLNVSLETLFTLYTRIINVNL